MVRFTLVVIAGAVAMSMLGGCKESGQPTQQAQTMEQQPFVYVVHRDDKSLADVATKVYGDGGMWEKIAKANPTIDPKVLHEGQRLMIPVATGKEGKTTMPRGCRRADVY